MRIENPISWLVKRKEDARIAEGIIALGCAEYHKKFNEVYITVGTEGKADAEAVRYIVQIRPDLEAMRQKMNNPDRMFANRHLNAALAGTDIWSVIHLPRLQRPRINFKRIGEISGVL